MLSDLVGGNLTCSRVGLDPSQPKPLYEILLLHSWVPWSGCLGKDNNAISRALSLSEERDDDLNSPRLSC